jgi:cobalamin biosynthesis protein CobW
VVGGSLRLEVPLTRQQLEHGLPAFVQAHRVIRLKGRIWLEGKSLPLQLQMVGPRLDSWFEAAPEQAWQPATGVGVDLVLIGFDPAAADQLSAELLALSPTNGSSPA